MEMPDNELLVTLLLEGEADSSGIAALRDACASDPELGKRFAREVALHRLTGSALAGRDGDSRFAAEVVARLQALASGDGAPIELTVENRLSRQIRFKRWSKGLAIAAVLALVAGLTFFMRTREGAVVSRCESVVWNDDGQAVRVGDRLASGSTVAILSGLAELSFSSGVTVLLEGPASLRITGGKSAVLDHGRLVARVTDSRGKGFVIDGPSGRVVDLGTAFGVSVEPSGEMEVHVLEGSVNATSNANRESVVELHRDEAMRLGRGGSERMAADGGAFVTDLPPMPGRSPGFIRWSFEETGEAILNNSGSGLAEDRAASRLLSASPEAALAERVAGRFGRALSFDGVDDFAESGFEGVSGQAPRTVAMWVRIPADLTPIQSYAMVGWGKVEGKGSAWQISVNPQQSDGPLGALRAGTGKGAVVGSTDLRDGKWHHLTVVMYGGREPTTATHVLLYVDGRLESTTRKSVRVINTEPSTEPHGVWLGRNLSVLNPDPPDARFFRGELDEVHIFSAALDQAMIRRVMGGQSPHH
jgi:ferric-dicitrate binding protein FerR (iron transport regulator)